VAGRCRVVAKEGRWLTREVGCQGGWLLGRQAGREGKGTAPSPGRPVDRTVANSWNPSAAFDVWTEFTVSTGKKEDTREECH
jgi:hypothetical protein